MDFYYKQSASLALIKIAGNTMAVIIWKEGFAAQMILINNDSLQ